MSKIIFFSLSAFTLVSCAAMLPILTSPIGLDLEETAIRDAEQEIESLKTEQKPPVSPK